MKSPLASYLIAGLAILGLVPSGLALATDDEATEAAIQHFSQNAAAPAVMPGTESQRVVVTADEAADSADKMVAFFTQDMPADVTVAARRRQVDLDVQFDFDSADLSNQGTEQLDNAGVALNNPELKSHRFMLSGHTDDVGDPAYNRMLSKKRAESAKEYLVEKYDVDADRLQTAGFGSEHPKVDDRTVEARRENRRVVIEMVD